MKIKLQEVLPISAAASRVAPSGADSGQSTIARMSKKRGYSDEFPTTGKTHRYMLDFIPAGLWRQVRAKAKREGVSLRTLILRLLTNWLNDRTEQAD